MNDGISQADFDIGKAMLNIIEPEKPRDPAGRFASTQEPEAPEVQEEQPTEEPQEQAPDEQPLEDDEIASPEDTEPEVPAIDPPAGLTADEIDVFRNSPPEVQKAWARREQERQREFRTWQNKKADTDKQVAERIQALESERQALLARANAFLSDAEAEFHREFGNVTDPTQLLNDPQKLLRYRALAMKIGQSRQAQEEMTRRIQQDQEQALQSYRAAENEKIRERFGLSDDKSATEFEKTVIADFLIPEMRNEGMDETRIKSAVQRLSAFELGLVRDAMKWRQAEAKRRAAEKSQKPVPKVMRPGTKSDTTPAQERAKTAAQRLAKTGRVEDAAAYFKTII